MKGITFFVLLCLAAGTLGAIELTLQASNLPEVKIEFSEHFQFPFLQGENLLTEDNNIDVSLGADLSPIFFNGIAEAVWTPIAFFQLVLGGKIGTGWNIELFGSDIYGIGLNREDADGKAEYSGSAFDGLLWKAHAGVVFQMDLAILYPGDWHHVFLRTYHEINRRGYTRAAADESWYYEDSEGENRNGFTYYGNLLIGYQMPFFINMTALLAEANMYLYDTPDRSRWGDDKMRWIFSALANFSITERLDFTLIAQLRTRRNYLNPNWEELYYRNRIIDSSNPLRLEFYRVVAILTYTW